VSVKNNIVCFSEILRLQHWRVYNWRQSIPSKYLPLHEDVDFSLYCYVIRRRISVPLWSRFNHQYFNTKGVLPRVSVYIWWAWVGPNCMKCARYTNAVLYDG